MPPTLEYWLPTSVTPMELEQKLADHPGTAVEGRETADHILLDTFDWRLFRRGTAIEQRNGEVSEFRWYHLGDGSTLYKLRRETPPRFAWDLPPGTFRRTLEEQIEMRALLPYANLHSRLTHLAVRDRRGKTVVRLSIEDSAVRATAAVPLRARLRISPVRGYPKALDRVRRERILPLQLAPCTEPLLTEALAAVDVVPGSYSSKVRVDLTPDMPAGEAVRIIMLRLLETMEANESGTIADTDSEFLHDFRVSVRRTRSALGQLRAVVPEAARERFREEFAWLGAVTGPTRDLDVHLLSFADYQASLPPDWHPALEPLHEFLPRLQRREQQALAKALRSRRYRSLKRDWRALLGSSAWAKSAPPEALTPAISIARERIWKMYRRACREGSRLHPQSPAEHLHELRKTCKKLRYLLEFFHGLFPPKRLGALLKTLKTLQDNLGSYNDLEVQAEHMKQFGCLMQEEGEAPAECLIAIGMLVEILTRRQTATREEFVEHFEDFASSRTRKKVRELFDPRTMGTRRGALP